MKSFLIGIFLFCFIAFIVLVLILVRFFQSINDIRRRSFQQRQRHARTTHTQPDGVEVYDTVDPQKREKKVISDNEGEYVEPVE